MTIEEARTETIHAWSRSYSPERNHAALMSIANAPIDTRISHLFARLFFRGIYFPQIGTQAWLKLLVANRRSISMLTLEGIGIWRAANRQRRTRRREIRVEALSLQTQDDKARPMGD